MEAYKKLLRNNKEWSSAQIKEDPEYFTRLVNLQSPETLWIGCSDSRVPADRITGTQPGEIFVHRNISNLVVHTDLNLLSVLEFAVEILKVRHVIVCGHHNCGGIAAALSHKSYGLIDQWLGNIKDVYRLHREEIDAEPTYEKKHQLLTKLNVKEQVINLAKTSIIQKAWKENKLPHLHGWVYDLRDGVINPVFEMIADTALDPIFEINDI
ncbi:MAG TPA: carbonic anhydrase [Hanamia sp.]|nr:carbonic anhydrase [Hanamia sp.]